MKAPSEWQRPHRAGIWLRSTFPLNPAFLLMASRSAFVGSPPWQLAQVSPFCEWMSWANFSAVTWNRPLNAEWHSRQVLWVCAAARPAQAKIISNKSCVRGSALFRRISIDGHRNDVAEREESSSHKKSPAAPASELIEEGKQQPEQTRGAKDEDTHDLTVHKPHFCRDLLKGLKHEHEIPFRTDAGWRRRERVSFGSEFPGQNRG